MIQYKSSHNECDLYLSYFFVTGTQYRIPVIQREKFIFVEVAVRSLQAPKQDGISRGMIEEACLWHGRQESARNQGRRKDIYPSWPHS